MSDSMGRRSPLAVALLVITIAAINGSTQDLIFADGFEAGSICSWANEWFPDADEDDWGDEAGIGIPVNCPPPSLYAGNSQDCDDWNPDVHPLATEFCDGEDNDCDDLIDDDAFCDLEMACCSGFCVDTGSDVEHCGACGNFCDLQNTSSHGCVTGECLAFVCNENFGDCDGVNSNGCETHTPSDLDHCGACGNICDLPHALLQTCVEGQCAVLICEAGYGNCDGNPFNGCGTDLYGDSFNCGGCGIECPLTQDCVNGLCVD